jgi:glutathione S-transferase
MRLITIPLSHYCEKARWGLVYAGVDYVEEAHLQVFHYAAVRPHSSRGMVPVLITETGAIADSTAILRFLDARLPDACKLYPEEQRKEVEALEDHFDETLGVETRRWVYFHWMSLPAREVMKTAGQGAPTWELRLAPMLFPLLRRFLGSRLAISSITIERGLKVISATFDEVAARLGDGRPYLCGSRFSAAYVAFACMAAPVLLPPEYGILLPTPEAAPVQAREDIRRFREHPAGQFALRLFRDHRRRAAVSSDSAP